MLPAATVPSPWVPSFSQKLSAAMLVSTPPLTWVPDCAGQLTSDAKPLTVTEAPTEVDAGVTFYMIIVAPANEAIAGSNTRINNFFITIFFLTKIEFLFRLPDYCSAGMYPKYALSHPPGKPVSFLNTGHRVSPDSQGSK